MGGWPQQAADMAAYQKFPGKSTPPRSVAARAEATCCERPVRMRRPRLGDVTSPATRSVRAADLDEQGHSDGDDLTWRTAQATERG